MSQLIGRERDIEKERNANCVKMIIIKSTLISLKCDIDVKVETGE